MTPSEQTCNPFWGHNLPIKKPLLAHRDLCFSYQARQASAVEREVSDEEEPLEPSVPEREQMDEVKNDEEDENEEEEEDEGELALWSPNVQVLELEKGERGLGFSILDYQVGKKLICLLLLFVFVFFYTFFNPPFLEGATSHIYLCL